MGRNWWAPLTGVGFILVAIVSIAVSGGEPPGADSPVQEIIDHYVDNKDAIEIGAFVAVAAAVLLVFFGAYLRTVLSAGEPAGMLSSLPLVGTAIVAVGLAIDSTISIALAEAVEDIDPAAVQALQALWDNDFVPFALGTLVFLISVGISIVRSGVLPKWLGWVALVLAVIGFTPIGFVAFVATGVWIAIVSVMLSLRARSASA